jgi:hypothetical protein
MGVRQGWGRPYGRSRRRRLILGQRDLGIDVRRRRVTDPLYDANGSIPSAIACTVVRRCESGLAGEQGYERKGGDTHE